MMEMIRADLALLGVRHDVFFSERVAADPAAMDRVAEAIAALSAKGLIYRGTLPPPKGQVPEDWEDREQTLFRSTEFGDDIDRPLMKSDGSYTYFASDIAYHYDKYLRGFRAHDRRARRRSRRLREAHEGGRHGDERRRGGARHRVLPAGASSSAAASR